MHVTAVQCQCWNSPPLWAEFPEQGLDHMLPSQRGFWPSPFQCQYIPLTDVVCSIFLRISDLACGVGHCSSIARHAAVLHIHPVLGFGCVSEVQLCLQQQEQSRHWEDRKCLTVHIVEYAAGILSGQENWGKYLWRSRRWTWYILLVWETVVSFALMGRGKTFPHLETPSHVLFAAAGGLVETGCVRSWCSAGALVLLIELDLWTTSPSYRSSSPWCTSDVLQVNLIFARYFLSYSTWDIYRSQFLW